MYHPILMMTPGVAGLRTSLVPAFRGCIVLGMITALAYALHLNSAATGFVFLMAIVLNCLDCGIAAAMVVSVAAVGLLNYFFIEPLLTFRVAHPVDVAALAAFLTASLVTTLLASKAREQARAARRDRCNLELLYDCAQRLLVLDPLRTEPPKFLEAVRCVFGLKAVSYFDAASATLFTAGDSRCGLAEKTRDAYIMGKDGTDTELATSLRLLRAGGRVLGAIGFEGIEHPEIMAGPAAALVAASLERAQACQYATRAEDAARAEILRTAILDSLAHEFKTPLATILTAAGGIRQAGPLVDSQAELAETIESEAERLGQISSRLLRIARIDSDDVRPRLEPFDVEAEVEDTVNRYAGRFRGRRIVFVNHGAPREVFADVELFQLALSQLLDNACKYSPPESTIDITLESDPRSFWVVVSNPGTAILPSERSLIFERFFRGSQGRRLAGTGLGLYVARKIALAHRGSLDLAPQSIQELVAFRLVFPIRRDEYVVAA